MVKADHPPLLPPGIHVMTLGDLRGMAASTRHGPRRTALQDGLEAFTRAMLSLIQDMEIYVDGSYLTIKDDPDDIDIVVFIDKSHINALSDADFDELQRLMSRDLARVKYGLDLYTEPLGDTHKRAYWRGVFGFAHDETTAKGFAWIKLSP